ncbi:MAG: ATP-grasp domain-containing protein [Bacteroidetes bacterium]|nr:MAG: ATP-grasp domain-containing protein [Bacteroidota bacterium]
MDKKITIAIVYNEPTNTQYLDGQKVISEAGILKQEAAPTTSFDGTLVDLSEIGVVEQKEQIAETLEEIGYRTVVFNVDGDVSRLVNFLKYDKPDLIFNMCESVLNKAIHEMHIAGIYELMGVNYTGAGPLVLGTALHKFRVKEILSFNGLPTPRYQVVKTSLNFELDRSLNFPLIVKPSREDASIGITASSVVFSANELKKQIRLVIEQFDQPAIVEEFIDGRELNVAIIGNRKPIAMPISEVDMTTLPSHLPRIITYNAKWVKGTAEYECTKGVCPALLPPELEERIKSLAIEAYQLIGCRDYARVDFRLSKDYQPYILEVNPNPDISEDAGFIRSAGVYGLSFSGAIEKIVECALERVP